MVKTIKLTSQEEAPAYSIRCFRKNQKRLRHSCLSQASGAKITIVTINNTRDQTSVTFEYLCQQHFILAQLLPSRVDSNFRTVQIAKVVISSTSCETALDILRSLAGNIKDQIWNVGFLNSCSRCQEGSKYPFEIRSPSIRTQHRPNLLKGDQILKISRQSNKLLNSSCFYAIRFQQEINVER